MNPYNNYKRTIFSWSIYDFANQPFTTIILTFVYSTFFAEVIASGEIQGTVLWGRAVTISSLMIALGIGTIIYNLKNFLFNYYPAPKYNMNDIYFGIFTGVLWVIIYLIRKYSQKSSLSRSVTSNLTSPRD